MPKKIYIVYGFAEGSWHGKYFREICQKQGLNVVESLTEADIIVTHSGGCFFINEARDDQMLVIINPPYWPGKKWVVRMRQKIWQDVQLGLHDRPWFSLCKFAWNLIYMVIRVKFEYQMYRNVDRFSLKDIIRNRKALIIRSSDDPWCSPDIEGILKPAKNLTVKQVGVTHDDCWSKPEEYVKAIVGAL